MSICPSLYVSLSSSQSWPNLLSCIYPSLYGLNLPLLVGSMFGHRDIYYLYKNGFKDRIGYQVEGEQDKAQIYLLDLEMEGYMDGSLLKGIGETYCDVGTISKNPSKGWEYSHRVLDMGYTPAYLAIYKYGYYREYIDQEKTVLYLLGAEEKGVRDSRILEELIMRLSGRTYYIPSQKVLGKFQSRSEMALHYCDVLIQRRSPLGYYWKGWIYWLGYDLQRDVFKARTIWEEADKLGLAPESVYTNPLVGLIMAYT